MRSVHCSAVVDNDLAAIETFLYASDIRADFVLLPVHPVLLGPPTSDAPVRL